MRKFAAAALAAALMVPALAGVQGRGIGFGCDNECPLATQANARRSFGLEAQGASKLARAELVAAVERNLSKV